MSLLGVNIAVLDDDRILLTQRDDFEVWCLPGGMVEPNETLAQAAIRECFEETGLQIALTHLIGVYSRAKWRDGSYNVLLFGAQRIGGELCLQEGEVLAASWFTRSALPEHLLLGQRHRILDALDGIGGSVVKSESPVWLFDEGISRQTIYDQRDLSPVSKRDFYQAHFPALQPDQINIEVQQVGVINGAKGNSAAKRHREGK